MLSAAILLSILLVVALLFDFLNGFHDSANVVATMIASRAMSPRAALWLAALANFIGPLLFGVAVAHTVGSEVVRAEVLSIAVVLAALLAASIWNLLTWWLGLPSSSSHALIGGIVGAAGLAAGSGAILSGGLWKIALALLLSPLLGFAFAIIVMHLTRFTLRNATPRANVSLSRLQILTATVLALGHGANDAQKTMGIIAMGLLTLGYTEQFSVPMWVILISAGAIAAGTLLGGWRIIRKLGAGFYRIRPIHGFTAQAASGAVILTASLLGGPVSTTQVVSMAILGAGAAERKSKVRWSQLNQILLAWVLTIPVSALVAMPVYLLITHLLPGVRP
jgi:PiT family inorganic phosphate transporter